MCPLNARDSVLPRTREFNKQKLKDEAREDSSLRTAPARMRRSSGPVSFAQQRLWLLDQLEPGIPLYNMAASYKLKGILNTKVLQRALAAIVMRHEALRTTFALIEDEPVQVIAEDQPLELESIDLRSWPEAEREAEAERLVLKEALRPFDLNCGPLFRPVLLCIGNEEHILLLTMHHIVSDGWSMSILLREMAVLYDAFAGGKPSPLPELPFQYLDFAVWQRQWLSG